ncbi:MAG: hypothetical protein AAF798_04625 [Bacteroidota bacterium]
MKTSLLATAMLVFASLPLTAQTLEITHYQPPNAPDSAWQYVFAQEKDGRLWAGNELGQLFQWRNLEWEEEALPNAGGAPITSMVAHEEKGLWVGTLGDGLYRKGAQGWEHWQSGTSALPSDTVWQCSATPAGGLWLAQGAAGFSHFSGGTWTHFTPANAPLPEAHVEHVLALSEERLWLATPHYLVYWGTDGWEWYELDAYSGFEGTQVLQLRWLDEQLYVATNKGLFRHRGETWEWCTEALGEEVTPDVAKTRATTLWFPEEGYGLHSIWDEMEWWSYLGASTNGVPRFTHTLFVDATGRLWMGTKEGGLILLNDRQLVLVNTAEALEEAAIAYPNPTAGTVHLSGALWETVTLVGRAGEVLQTWVNAEAISLEPYPAGKYLLHLQGRDKVAYVVVLKVN